MDLADSVELYLVECLSSNMVINFVLSNQNVIVMILGSTMVFRMYGLVCAGMLVLFTLVNFYNMKEGGFSTELGEDIDPRNVMESEHLAPHGVPGGFKPMSRSRRNSTEDMQAAVTQPNPMDDPGIYNII